MKKPKLIFYIIYLVFHIGLLAVALLVKYYSGDVNFLFGLLEKINWLIYAAVLGLLLFFVNMLLVNMQARAYNKELEALEKEINSTKAKMFDLQEASNVTNTTITEGTTEEDISDEPKSE